MKNIIYRFIVMWLFNLSLMMPKEQPRQLQSPQIWKVKNFKKKLHSIAILNSEIWNAGTQLLWNMSQVPNLSDLRAANRLIFSRFGNWRCSPMKELLIRQLGLSLMILIFQHWEGDFVWCGTSWSSQGHREPDMEPMGWRVWFMWKPWAWFQILTQIQPLDWRWRVATWDSLGRWVEWQCGISFFVAPI